VIFVLVAAVFVLNTLVESTRSSIYGLVIQGVGVIFYLVWRSTVRAPGDASRARAGSLEPP
jgi:threonine/homoserine/homoserine lactone efflux protein